MFEHISIGLKAPDIFNVVIEIPRGSHNKYEYDEELGAIKLDRVLFSPFYYPTDYGFIPQTRSEDDDHLDALVVTTDSLFPGCIVAVRPVALFKMRDSGDMDEKILTVAADDPRFSHVVNIDDFSPHLPKEIAHFFESYKKLEGKSVEILGWEDRNAALDVLRKSQERWGKERS